MFAVQPALLAGESNGSFLVVHALFAAHQPCDLRLLCEFGLLSIRSNFQADLVDRQHSPRRDLLWSSFCTFAIELFQGYTHLFPSFVLRVLVKAAFLVRDHTFLVNGMDHGSHLGAIYGRRSLQGDNLSDQDRRKALDIGV